MTVCKQCANKEIKQSCSIKIEHPFSIEIKCKYFKNIVSRTDGM